MTRQHFILIAEAVASMQDPFSRQSAAEALAKKLATVNPRFDRDKFIAACGARVSR
jgi:hypothetical protein